MDEVSIDRAAIGKVVGYSASWNPLSHESYVVVKVEDKKIVVPVDARQLKFVQKEYPPGSLVAVGFYGGKWHIGSKLTDENTLIMETGISIQEVIDSLKKIEPC